jgi:hypothetical protein
MAAPLGVLLRGLVAFFGHARWLGYRYHYKMKHSLGTIPCLYFWGKMFMALTGKLLYKPRSDCLLLSSLRCHHHMLSCPHILSL